MWTGIYRHIAKVYAISRGFYVGSFVLMARFTVSLHRKVGRVVSVKAIQLEVFNRTKLFTPRVSDGCNSFGIVCLSVCLCVCYHSHG